jgi:hypothetical protein
VAAPKGNQFWRARSKHGRDKIFKTPDDLWDSCCEYFDWAEDNPLLETKSYMYQGKAVQDQIPKLRAMTVEGLCLFLHVNSKYFNDFEAALDMSDPQDKDFSDIITRAKDVIRQQKFAGAAADQLNANIIARDLGLTDKKEVKTNSNVRVSADMSPQDAARAYQELMGDGDN